jgi:hypothetical protein
LVANRIAFTTVSNRCKWCLGRHGERHCCVFAELSPRWRVTFWFGPKVRWPACVYLNIPGQSKSSVTHIDVLQHRFMSIRHSSELPADPDSERHTTFNPSCCYLPWIFFKRSAFLVFESVLHKV